MSNCSTLEFAWANMSDIVGFRVGDMSILYVLFRRLVSPKMPMRHWTAPHATFSRADNPTFAAPFAHLTRSFTCQLKFGFSQPGFRFILHDKPCHIGTFRRPFRRVFARPSRAPKIDPETLCCDFHVSNTFFSATNTQMTPAENAKWDWKMLEMQIRDLLSPPRWLASLCVTQGENHLSKCWQPWNLVSMLGVWPVLHHIHICIYIYIYIRQRGRGAYIQGRGGGFKRIFS